ncbi:hypothetical protein WISP_110391 [Willisornis vidua]|uniref:Uncharacterized protein n=1 Tax=Willisornis vidua TaxID=1566151 RepID=A0ABQ9CVK4_9PASS|nr:hypothetical protein WISP_110391 [Willisornis vidua]
MPRHTVAAVSDDPPLHEGDRGCWIDLISYGDNGPHGSRDSASAYSFAMGSWPKNGLLDMNKGLNLQHIGRPHSGIGHGLPALLCTGLQWKTSLNVMLSCNNSVSSNLPLHACILRDCEDAAVFLRQGLEERRSKKKIGAEFKSMADDCKNIANIMKTLAHRGFIFKQTSKPF